MMIEMILQILAVIGLLLSLYAFYVEKRFKANSKYHAACDINNKISCTKAFKSKYGHTFGISNSIFGIFFYAIIFVLLFMNLTNIVFYLSTISLLGSLYLAYVLYFKVRSFCIVCNSIYVVNILLFVVSLISVL